MKPDRKNGVLNSGSKRLSKSTAASSTVGINSIYFIYFLTLMATVAALAMFWIEFFLPQFHVGLERSFVYYSLLSCYVVYKETRRWLDQHQGKRTGNVWVPVWWISTFLMEIISFLKHERYTPLAEQYLLTMAVSANFLFSRISKITYDKRKAKR